MSIHSGRPGAKQKNILQFLKMDLENILRLLSHTQTDNENDYSEVSVENTTHNQNSAELSMDFFQEIKNELDMKNDLTAEDEELIDLDEFQDILGDLNEVRMRDEYQFPMYDINYNREHNNSGLINENKALLNLSDSNVMLEVSVDQNAADVVALNNGGKTDIDIEPFSIYPAVKDKDTHKSKTDRPTTSLPCFQDAFNFFINLASDTSTGQKFRNHNILQYEFNADNSQKGEGNELQNSSINIDDNDCDIDDITVIEDQVETCDSVLANDVKFIDNYKFNDDFAIKQQAYAMEYDSDCPGYHSSDFEFISESEAEMDGVVTNDSKKLKSRNNKTKTITNTVKVWKNNIFSLKYLHEDCYPRRGNTNKDDEDRENNHKIPEGDDFFNLFQENNVSIVPLYYIMENKSLGGTSFMAIEHDGIGFDMRTMGTDDVDDDELKEDAKRSVKKILEMYPFENSKQRRH